MAATPYKPTSWTDPSLSREKLQQMTNNDQWLFENTPRIRYNAHQIIRDSGVKIIAGKVWFTKTSADNTEDEVYFGSFFTAGCRPVIVASVETTGALRRKYVDIRGLGAIGNQVDYRGFVAHLSTHEPASVASKIEASGWIHWIAVGW